MKDSTLDLPVDDQPYGITTLDPRVTNIIYRSDVTPAAELLYLRAAVHAARYDGFIALNVLLDLTRGIPRPKARVRELVEAGYWCEVEWGWRVDLYGTRHLCTTNDRHLLSPALRRLVLDRDSGRCQACGTTDNPVIDHIVPVAKGGRTVAENLQVLCAACNGSKGARDWDEWLASR